jgi:hypothetical protein
MKEKHCYIKNENGEYITRRNFDGVSWTKNRKLACVFGLNKMQAPGAVEHWEKHLGCKIVLEERM